LVSGTRDLVDSNKMEKENFMNINKKEWAVENV
jgi:hypothetical protein